MFDGSFSRSLAWNVPYCSPGRASSWCLRYTSRPVNQPSALPTRTSDAKWSLLATRDALIALALPYAKIFVSHPGYSLAATAASDHAAVACLDGKELPAFQ